MKRPYQQVESPVRVVNIKSGEHYDVYIGRPSKWGNPFRIGRDGDRAEVLRKYRKWLTAIGRDGRHRSLFYDATTELSGKVLGCYCAPEPCHGDVIIEAMDAYWHGLWSS